MGKEIVLLLIKSLGKSFVPTLLIISSIVIISTGYIAVKNYPDVMDFIEKVNQTNKNVNDLKIAVDSLKYQNTLINHRLDNHIREQIISERYTTIKLDLIQQNIEETVRYGIKNTEILESIQRRYDQANIERQIKIGWRKKADNDTIRR